MPTSGMARNSVGRSARLTTLVSTVMVRVLKPWTANLKKRQVKAPKIYLRDSEILHRFVGLPNRVALDGHPKVGASWEGFVLENVIQALGLEDRQCYYWRTHAGAEIDLVVDEGDALRGIGIKRSSGPRLTASMSTALRDLGLRRIDVIHAVNNSYPLAENIQAVSLPEMIAMG